MCFFVYFKLKYTEEYEQSRGKGSFPAMITPGYQAAKQANTLASSVCRLFDSCIFLKYNYDNNRLIPLTLNVSLKLMLLIRNARS